MRNLNRWLLLFTLALQFGRLTPSAAQEPRTGAHLFHQYCASCHGENGNGNGPVAPYLMVKPLNLTTITERRQGKFPEEQILRIVAGDENPPGHGTRTMPVWGERLQDDLIGGVSKPAVAQGRVAFLVDYLKTIQGADKKEFENVVIPSGGLRPDGAPIR
ncbi:MAG: cytochrome c [Deltaproteobacteria bacterium]|nr:cytochrome c [Deltaproteobacteria bacterium]